MHSPKPNIKYSKKNEKKNTKSNRKKEERKNIKMYRIQVCEYDYTEYAVQSKLYR